MLIYDILKMDHRMIMNIIDAIGKVTQSNRRKHMLMLVDTELAMHHKAEETVFYRALHHSLPDEMHLATSDEHDKIDSILATLQFSPADSTDWITTLGILRTTLQQHIMKEETAVFTLAQKQFTNDEALEMGMHMLEEKGKLGMSNLFMVASHKMKELASDK